eukprot:5651391-Prymnesium_polylepis.1
MATAGAPRRAPRRGGACPLLRAPRGRGPTCALRLRSAISTGWLDCRSSGHWSLIWQPSSDAGAHGSHECGTTHFFTKRPLTSITSTGTGL